jgi:ornithine--oxo-acid transaminase
MLTLGKSLSGGMFPISVCLADNKVMDLVGPNQHGSTFGGSPLASAVCMKSLEVLQEEGMVENSYNMGNLFRVEMEKLVGGYLQGVRGRGLMNALVLDESSNEKLSNWEFSLELARKGLLVKPIKTNIIRLMPPLIINEEQVHTSIATIAETLKHF